MKKVQITETVLRDANQSLMATRLPYSDFADILPEMNKAGYYSVECWGGATFDSCLRYLGEDPWQRLRDIRKAMPDTKLQMLLRGQNLLGYKHYHDDVVEKFVELSIKNGIDIIRIFDALNDFRNLGTALDATMKYAKKNTIASGCISYTQSPVHTVEKYVQMCKELKQMGFKTICLKDMAGIGRPETLGKICAGIKAYKKDIIVQYHSHAGPGFNMASILEVCKNGCDYVDTAVAPLAWGTGHADILAVQAMLKDAGFKVKEINMAAYMEVRSQIQEMMDDFLGLYCNPLNRINNSLLIAPGLPGGMMGSLMADLETNLESLNKWKAKHGQAELTQDELLVKLFDEVAYIWPKVGYPCLVTPFSQYVKNLALMNVIQMEKGKERWSMIADDIWDMILGKAGRLPGEVAPELKALAEAQGRKFSDTDPQANYPDELDKYRQMMAEKGWDTGQDDEELFEYAMHPSQYEAYKSGKAKQDFLADLQKRREAAAAPAGAGSVPAQPSTVTVTVNGQSYKVDIAYGEQAAPAQTSAAPTAQPAAATGEGEDIPAPLEGKFYRVKNTEETPKQPGDRVKAGDILGYIEAMKTYNAIRAEFDGTITAILVNSGDAVEEDDVIMKIAKQ